jgi:hypothetical protein
VRTYNARVFIIFLRLLLSESSWKSVVCRIMLEEVRKVAPNLFRKGALPADTGICFEGNVLRSFQYPDRMLILWPNLVAGRNSILEALKSEGRSIKCILPKNKEGSIRKLSVL